MGQLTGSAFQVYNPNDASSIQAGPFALYQVPVDVLNATQLNVGFAEVDKKADGFNELTTQSALAADLLTDIEPVVIGPGGVLYQTDGHHTFLALIDSAYGGSADPMVDVNVIANFSNLTTQQFYTALEQDNLIYPVNDGVLETVNTTTGAPLPTSLTGLTSDPYRGLEYSILKNKNSKLFTTASNITGAIGSAVPGLDKTAAFYSDFIYADAYRDANGGLGLPYLSPGDIALSTAWNLNGNNVTTLPGVGSIKVAQLPGYILPSGSNIVITGTISKRDPGQRHARRHGDRHVRRKHHFRLVRRATRPRPRPRDDRLQRAGLRHATRRRSGRHGHAQRQQHLYRRHHVPGRHAHHHQRRFAGRCPRVDADRLQQHRRQHRGG